MDEETKTLESEVVEDTEDLEATEATEEEAPSWREDAQEAEEVTEETEEEVVETNEEAEEAEKTDDISILDEYLSEEESEVLKRLPLKNNLKSYLQLKNYTKDTELEEELESYIMNLGTGRFRCRMVQESTLIAIAACGRPQSFLK